MTRLAPIALVLACAVLSVQAQAPAPAQPEGVAPAPSGRVPEPAVQHTRIEDDSVRIEELRVRGQNQRLVVRPKKGAPAYEVVPADGSRDLSQDANRGTAGRRVWNVINF